MSQPGQCYRDQPADRGLGCQAVGCREGVEAIGRKFVRRDVVPEVAYRCALGQQIADELVEMVLRLDDVFASMQACGEFGAMVLLRNERVGLKYGLQPLTGVASLVPDCNKMFEVTGDLTFVPGDEDRFDVREVFVQRCATYSSLLGDFRHRHRQQPMLGHQRSRGVQARVAYGAAVRIDGFVP